MKSSTIGRAFELLKLASKVGVKEFKSGDFKSRYEQAMMIVKSLSHLKGAAMKAGQLLSLDLDNYFPPEAIEILSQLQNSAVAHPFYEIKKTIDTEIKESQKKLISSINEIPLGVASIGQVHKARYIEQDIVLKVQYPNVSHSVDSDLKILKVLASSFCQMSGRKMNLEPLFNEFKFILEQELDYYTEAKFQIEFQKKIEALNHNDLDFEYKVPEVISELSTQKILAMSFAPGLALKDWVKKDPDEKSKVNIAIAILDLYFHEFFDWGLVQTDPNWGNFIVNESEDKLSLCLIDFGATRRYSKKFIQNYTQLLILTAQNESQQLKNLAIEMRFLDARESDSAFSAFENSLKLAIKPFFIEETGESYFDFSDKNHSLESNQSAKTLARELIYSPPPYEIIFLHRKLAGVYSILKSLKVKMDISSYWNMMLELSERKI